MSRKVGWLAWGAWALTVLAVGPILLLVSLNEPSSLVDMLSVSVLVLAFATVGALISSRQPGNSIGWLFCAGSLAWILGEVALEYGVYALITAPGTLPAGAWAAWFGSWMRGMGWFLIVLFLLLLFPDGRLPTPRWRPVLWAAMGFVVLFTLALWLSPESQDFRLTSIRNPLGLELGYVRWLEDVSYLGLPLILAACGMAVVARFRRSAGAERQQLKWFAYAVAVMVAVFAVWISLAIAGFVPANPLLFTVPLAGLPVAVGTAILKYRLYDIDVLINRTLVYGASTISLALVYFASVVLLQSVFRTLTGSESQLAVVASTLAIAALFNPLRKRIQASVDRRFYRRKYDAQKTLEAFTAKLRRETDLENLRYEMLEVVRDTVQPEKASLWLKGSSRNASRNGSEMGKR